MRLKTRPRLLPAPFWARRLPPAALGPGRSPAASQIYQRLQWRSFPWNQTDRRPGPAISSRAPCASCLRHVQVGLESERGRPWLSIEPSGDEKHQRRRGGKISTAIILFIKDLVQLPFASVASLYNYPRRNTCVEKPCLNSPDQPRSRLPV